MKLLGLKRNTTSFIYFVLFAVPFIFGAMWQSRENNPFISKLPLINSITNLPSGSNSLLYIGFQLFLFTFPIFLISILELQKANGTLKNRFLSTSLGRIYYSKGHKFADLWYSAAELIFNKLPEFITFLTLGISIFNSKVSVWFTTFYSNTLNIPSSPIISLVIFLTALLLNNLISYLDHRIAHQVPFLWDLHELHHSPTEMTMLSKDRKTPFDNIFFAVISTPFIALCSLLTAEYLKQGFILPLVIYILYVTLDNIHSWVGHSSYRLVYPKPFNYILMSPSLHWIHHSSNPKHFRSNFGNTITLWDKVFNTYLDETHLEEIKSYGFKNSEYNLHHPIYSLIFLPIIKMKKRLVKINKRTRRRIASSRN